MSGARAVGGIRRTTGRKGRRPFDDPNLNREELSALRAAMADRARRGLPAPLPVKVRKKDWGTKSGRARPLVWRPAFLKVYERTGSVRRAAAEAGVSYSAASKQISRDTWMRAECELARAKWLFRQIQIGVRCGTRLSLGRRHLASLLLLIRKGGVFE